MNDQSREARDQAGPPAAARPPLDVGWVITARSEASAAVESAMALFQRRMQTLLPEFTWRLHLQCCSTFEVSDHASAVELMDLGLRELNERHWDFAFVLSVEPLRGYRQARMLGAPASAVDVAVVSLPALREEATSAVVPSQRLAERLMALALHLFGHLNGLSHAEERTDFMTRPRNAADLEQRERLDAEALAQLRERLRGVADARVEERPGRIGAMFFTTVSMWENRGEILRALYRMSPWEFPFRYSRLTTAAASTMLVLLISAEAWELGMSQTPLRVALFSLLALGATTLYLQRRQRLLRSSQRYRRTEQLVSVQASLALGLLVGMLTTYVVLFTATLAAALGLFSVTLVDSWNGSEVPSPQLGHYLRLGGFVSALGVSIGALGASFENEDYFRHIALFDEET